jgi:glycosyltransferase involved in cell wall biosynthesis
VKASVLLLTFNEEGNLPRCLQTLAWCDDIVAVDSGSTDRTVEILQSYGVRIIARKFQNFADQRNYALEHANFRYEWVLHLDADEVLPTEFQVKLAALEPQEGIDGYYVASKTILFGRWLKYAGMWPAYQARLGHKKNMRFKQVGHGQREDVSPDRMARFSEPYLHYNFSHGMQRWLEKHIRYAKDEAALLCDLTTREKPSFKNATTLRRALKSFAAYIPLFLRPVMRFAYVYIWWQGFRDGRAGLAYAVMLSVYEGMIAVFAYETLLVRRVEPGLRQPERQSLSHDPSTEKQK